MPRGCTLDEIHSDTIGLIMRSTNRQLLPANRDEYVYVPNRDGAYIFPEGLEDLFLEVEFSFLVGSHNEIRSKAREVANWLYKKSRVKLVFDDEPDKYYMAKVSNQLDLEPQIRAGRLTVEFRCLPFAYSTTTNNEVTWGSEIITFNSDYLMGHEGGETKTITGNTSFNVVVSGYESLKPIFNIAGSGTNVIVGANGKTFTLDNLSGSAWSVIGDKQQVVKDGLNGLKHFSGDFLELISGDNEITVSGTSMNFTLQVTFRDKYL